MLAIDCTLIKMFIFKKKGKKRENGLFTKWGTKLFGNYTKKEIHIIDATYRTRTYLSRTRDFMYS